MRAVAAGMSPAVANSRNDPGHFLRSIFQPQVASACAIAINVFVHSPNELEKSSIDVLSPRLASLNTVVSYSKPIWSVMG